MDTPTVLDIAPGGDVILAVPGDHAVRLRTSSHVLRLASSVFKAMLKPTFKEGSSLAADGTVEIELQDDDPSMMTTMMKIMHVCSDVMEHVPSTQELALLTQLADKYDAVGALRPVTHYYLQQAIPRSAWYQSHWGTLLAVAFKFKHADLFQKIANNIIKEKLGPVQSGHPDMLPDVLPFILGEYSPFP